MRELSSIVLASVSPRRYELLRSVGFDVTVVPSRVAEDERTGVKPRDLAADLAAAKADAVFGMRPSDVVLGADTVVDADGRLFGKPRDAEDARRMLRALAGREHIVHSAYSLRGWAGALDGIGSTRVRFAPRDDDAIEAYIASGEPFDKAGAYGVQGRGAALVEGIDGDFYTVMGLPLGDLLRRLRERGWAVPALRPMAAA